MNVLCKAIKWLLDRFSNQNAWPQWPSCLELWSIMSVPKCAFSLRSNQFATYARERETFDKHKTHSMQQIYEL